jgi:hypothetical protein
MRSNQGSDGAKPCRVAAKGRGSIAEWQLNRIDVFARRLSGCPHVAAGLLRVFLPVENNNVA